ncbi:hypothetical protein ECC02_006874 [Trypanosoma cruzi]|uniref:Uncharacterized protein n=1 Tax=Trypanosoma cruzi TaxID=5693 RepID=A0A7J6Y1E8_TRYCR|nr:hypothetical protein ECC02_006874 [Trypanosoma cruzi]
MDGSIGGKLTPPQFIRAGVFMCRPIHREGNGGPFLLRCTAGSTVATCVHRIGQMAHSTQHTISAMHAHIKATESTILILSLSTDSRTLLPRPHTNTSTRYLRLPSLGAHEKSTGTTTASASPDTCPGLPATTRRTRSKHPPQQPHAQGTTRATEPSSIHDAAKNFLPSRPQWDTEPNSTQSHAPHHTRRKGTRAAHSLSSLLLMATEEDNSRHTQLPACTTKGAFKSTATCTLCLCACRNTKQRSRKKGAEYVEGRTTKMYSGDA